MRRDRQILACDARAWKATRAAVLVGVLLAACSKPAAPVRNAPAAVKGPPSLTLDARQLDLIQIVPVSTRPFKPENQAVGNIDYNEDRAVQVYTPYQGKIIAALRQLGDAVHKDEPLYTIQSPDLLAAESNLITAAANYDMNTKALERARRLRPMLGVSDQTVEQAQAAQIAADGALKSAREAVKVFGKTDTDVARMEASRQVDPVLIVRSPITGVITARNAQSGLYVQPGNPPAPYAVADLSTKWMLADAVETDAPLFHIGQPVRVTVSAYPNEVFTGKISKIAPSVDPNVHTLQIRSEIKDPKGLLKPGMLANFVIQTGGAVSSPALPADSVVREPDGVNTAWVTTDRRRFVQRVVTVGLLRDGYFQVRSGVGTGELVVGKGAVFLDNTLNAPPED